MGVESKWCVDKCSELVIQLRRSEFHQNYYLKLNIKVKKRSGYQRDSLIVDS